MDEKLILAIDQGTTGSTVLVFNHAARVVGKAYSEFTQHYPSPGWVEHDAVEIWEVTRGLIGKALASAGAGPGNVAGIGITNQRETCVLWDRIGGKPLSRAIVWQDRRTAELCSALRQEGLEEDWRARTGLLLDPYFSGTKLHWMLENVPGARTRAEEGELAFGTIDSWLAWNLTGGKAHITDFSNASRTLLYNIRELSWDSEILSRLDIPRQLLPSVEPSSKVYAETDPSVLGVSVPLAGIAGDQQAALFGQACFERGMLKNTYGTGSFLLMNTGHEAVACKERLLTTIAWGIADQPVEYALEGSIFVTGAAVQWLRDGLGIIGAAAETQALAESLDTNDDVYFVPALTGLGAPYWDPFARGALVGLTRGTTRAHIARAALEAISYQTRDVVEAMVRESGVGLSTLRADGGAVANDFLMQFQSDILNVKVDVPAVPETTALGAACLAGLAVGFWSGKRELSSKWECVKSFGPAMIKSESDVLYKRWRQAVERALGWAQPLG